MVDSLKSGFQVMASTALVTTSTTFPQETTTEPVAGATRAVVKVPSRGPGSILVGNAALFLPFGVGSATNTFIGTMVGWKLGGAGIYVPWPLWTLKFTLGTLAGAAGGMIGASALWAATIDSTSSGYYLGSGDVALSPADNTIASVKFDYCGAAYLELIGNRNSSATSFNGAVAFMD
jgi:hypothetical protein